MAEGESRNLRTGRLDIRPLAALADFELCVDLQREAFGWADLDLMPSRLMVVLHHIGGLVLGAWEGSRLVGFLNMFPGTRASLAPNPSYWHSHMLAVSPSHWNAGIGAALKLAQRDHARQRGIRLIEWTYDPLESRNAHFNIAKLGIVARRYYVNFYGHTTGALQKGLESDRLVAEWWVDRPRIPTQGEVRRIAIPADLQALKQRDLEAARQVQERVRSQFLHNFADGFIVAGFERKGDTSEYVLLREESGRAHSRD